MLLRYGETTWFDCNDYLINLESKDTDAQTSRYRPYNIIILVDFFFDVFNMLDKANVKVKCKDICYTWKNEDQTFLCNKLKSFCYIDTGSELTQA